MDLLWVTDPHLNFLSRRQQRRFGKQLSEHGDALVVTGDIAENPTLVKCLRDLAGSYGKPVYFVLGNHDFYKGSFEETKALARGISGKSLHWLTEAGIIELNSTTALVGHDGFYDGRYGTPLNDWGNPGFVMSDWTYIKDFKGLHIQALIHEVDALGQQAAEDVRPLLNEALVKYETVVVATHYPPYREATWHKGKMSDPYAMPWFSCKAMGDMLFRAALDHPDRKIIVLCGHTHSPGVCQIHDNLTVYTGQSEYDRPQVSGLLKF